MGHFQCCFRFFGYFNLFRLPPKNNSEMIRIRARKSTYGPKVGVTDHKSELQPGRPPESEPNRPEKEPESGLDASTETPP